MNRVLLVLFAVFAFAARSDGVLKCFVCDSLANPACGDPSKESNSQLVPCDIPSLTNWYTEMVRRTDLSQIAKLFEVDNPQYTTTHLTDLACAKMNIKLGPKNVTLRSCQSAQTPTVDTCRAIQDKLSHMPTNTASMSYCGLCNTDGCNGAVDISPPKILQLLFGSLGLMMIQLFRQHFA